MLKSLQRILLRKSVILDVITSLGILTNVVKTELGEARLDYIIYTLLLVFVLVVT